MSSEPENARTRLFLSYYIDLSSCSRVLLALCFTTWGRHHCSHFTDDESEAQRGVSYPSSQGQIRNSPQVCLAPKPEFFNHSGVYIPRRGEDFGIHWASQRHLHICYLTSYWTQGWCASWCLWLRLFLQDMRRGCVLPHGMGLQKPLVQRLYDSNQSHPEKGRKPRHQL